MMKKIAILITGLIFMISCQKKTQTKQSSELSQGKQKDTMKTFFYVGTYTNKNAKGIYKYEFSKEGEFKQIGLVATTDNPSFLTKTKRSDFLIAVNETDKEGTGFVRSFKILKDSLQFINEAKSGGAHPCFITVNKESQVLVANYTGGNIGLLKIDSLGKLSPLLNIQQHEGKGTTDRQKLPHAHSTWFHPTKEEVISVDLGTNELWFSKIEENKLILKEQKTLKMTDGAGPRHLTFHPNNEWFYVLNELNNTVSLVKEKEGTYFVDSSISTLPKDFTDYSSAADIHISKDGKFLYASNRGHNSLVIYEINQKSGALKLVGFEPVLGKNPRNFTLSLNDNFILIANQDTNNIVCFKRDIKTGKLTFVSEVFAPTPVCILF